MTTTTFTKSVRISGAILLSALLASCMPCEKGSGEVLQESRPLEAFSSVEVRCPVNVFISQNHFPTQATVKAQKNIADLLSIEVENGVLTIDSDDCFQTKEVVEVYLNTERVEGLAVYGSGDIHGLTDLLGGTLKMKVKGSGDITAEGTYRHIQADIQGSGDIRFNGKADRLEVTVKGSGDFKGQNMTAKSTSVKISGSGDAFVNAEEFLEASVAGSGDVRYTGAPRDSSFSVKGSGNIRPMR